jgi:selenocysteine lyase/cysteine desulfurase
MRRWLRSAPGARRTLATGYQSIGSFHSQDVEELVRLPLSAYGAPPLPFASAAFGDAALHAAAHTTFGADFRRHYLVDFEAWTFVNHGAFGATLRPAFDLAAEWRRYAEAQPLRYFDRDLLPHLAHAVRASAEFVRCAPAELVLCANATAGLNAAVRGAARSAAAAGGTASGSGARSGRRRVVLFDTAYGAVKTLAKRVCDESSCSFTLALAASPSLVLSDAAEPDAAWARAWSDALRAALDDADAAGEGAAIVVVDHVTSNTALALPLVRLAALCAERGVLLVVDGAHGALCEPLDVRSLLDAGVFAYVTNTHKWLSAPKSAALLCVAEQHHAHVTPAVLSHGANDGFLSSFVWDGARDYCAALTLSGVYSFWNAVGLERARAHCDALATEAAIELARAWRVGGATSDAEWVAAPPQPPLTAHCMRLIPLPRDIGGGGGRTSADAKAVQDALHEQHRIEAPVKCIGGDLHVRISAHVYNELADYERLAAAVTTIVAESDA